jgi:DNA-3-methyladenine glycosylase I
MDPHVVFGDDGVTRCWWGASTPDYAVYHDTEWGLPVADDHVLFEKLSLEGFQSGLSWLTILRKRDDFRRVFHGFDYQRIAEMGASDVDRLLDDATIVRHRAKIESTINNARRAIDLAADWGTLGAFFWSFEPATPSSELSSETAESRAMADELKRRGFTWVGPTTAYAFMQAMGIVNDHLPGCDARRDVDDARRMFVRPARP